MPDHKTVTFDATLLPCPFCGGTDLEITNTHTASFWIVCNDCDAEAHGDYVEGPQRDDKFHYEASPDDSGFEAAYNDLYPEYQAAFRSAVVAWNTRAPTPAAQSAGQEAVFRLYKHDGDFDVEVQAGVFNKMPKGEYMLYAAPVNGGEPVAWAVFDSEHLVSTVVDPVARKTAESAGYTLRPLVYGDAAPVNGGEQPAKMPQPVPANAVWTRHGSGDCEWWDYGSWKAHKRGGMWALTAYGKEIFRAVDLQRVMAFASQPASAALSSPAKVGGDEREAMTDGEFRDLVNKVTNTAKVFGQTQQLRERIRDDLEGVRVDGGEDKRDAERWRKFLRVYTYYRWSLFDSPEEIIRELDATVVDPAIIAAKAKGE